MVLSMIEWYGTPDELNISEHDMELIEKWVEDNKKNSMRYTTSSTTMRWKDQR